MDTQEAVVKYPGGKVIDGKYGPYRDAVLSIGEDEVKVFAGEGEPAFDALPKLEKGQAVQVIRRKTKSGKTKYELADSEIDALVGGHRGSGRSGNGRAANGQHTSAEKEGRGHQRGAAVPRWNRETAEAIKKRAEEQVSLLSHIYARLDVKFEERELNDEIRTVPTSSDLQRMAVSVAIQLNREAS